MSRRKYPKTTGYYVYCHITPDEMFYIGMSKQQPYERWNPSQYRITSLQPYIEKYGWNNIKHVILKDGLTDKQAEQLEELLIQEATRQGFNINKKGSGGKERDNPKKYKREYRKTEKCKEYEREYRQRPEVKQRKQEWQREYEKTDKRKEYKHEYEKTDKRKEYLREYRQRTEVKERQREHQRQYRLKKKALKNEEKSEF